MPGREKKLVAFAVYPGVTPLDLIGPLTILRNLPPYRTVVVGERTEPLGTDTRLRLVPAATFREVSAPFAVIVPVGGAATVRALEDAPLLAYLRAAAGTAEVVGSTGNGALILAAAGLLAGRGLAVLLVALFPANVHAARRGVDLGGKPATPLGFRTVVQGLFIALTLWASTTLPPGRGNLESGASDRP